jgi:hypothetical protein
MKRIFKGLLQKAYAAAPIQTYPYAPQSSSRELQILLSLKYREFATSGQALDFDEIGFNVYSSTNEDGILLYIFSLIGMGCRRCVDIGAGQIKGSNVANLVVNHGFSALLLEGNPNKLAIAQRYYRHNPETMFNKPKLVQTFVTAENINTILCEHRFAGEIDLLSLDIDGVDYWIWKAISVNQPRVVLVEYQDILGPERALTVPYDAHFDVSAYPVNRTHYNYAGASLLAFTKLAHEKGYRLVGCSKGGYNAFFVRNDLGNSCLPEVTVESCFHYEWNQLGMTQRYPLVKDMKWQEV